MTGTAAGSAAEGRHRHDEDVREDGLAAVLGPVRRTIGLALVALTDLDSGMLLDAWAPDPAWDPEVVGPRHAEVARLLLGPSGSGPRELLVEDGAVVHLLLAVPDPHGGDLLLSAALRGGRRRAARVRRRLRQLPARALTAGPTLRRRPDRFRGSP